MNHRQTRSDVPSFRRALLDSARLDAQPVPAAVRRRLLMAASVAGLTSATAGAGAASIGTSLAVGVAKCVGVGTLFISVGAATFHATRGVWHAPPIASSAAVPPKVIERHSTSKPTPRGDLLSPLPNLPAFDHSGAAAIPESPQAPSSTEVAARLPTRPSSVGSQGPDITSKQTIANSAIPYDSSSVLRDAPLGSNPNALESAGEPPTLAPATSLTVELDKLDRARARLAAGDPNGTLVSLETYAREFPNGGLHPEAMLLRIQALHQSGQRTSARALGLLFLKQYPSSPHAKRVYSLIQSKEKDDDS